MKYCIPYYRMSQYKDTVDEVSVLATEPREIGGITGFMNTRPAEQRVFFIFRNMFFDLDNVDFNLLRTSLKGRNYTICWEEAGEVDPHIIANKCKEYELNFCFAKPVYNYDVLYGLCDIGVSDVFISGSLGFDKDSIKRVKRRYENLTVRAYPDICQSEWNAFRKDLCFWVRPEDTKYYEDFIDVFHSWCGHYGQVYADTWYEIYAKDGYWLGDLTKLIRGLREEEHSIDGRCFTGDWGRNRSECGRACLRDSQCTLCPSMLNFANTLHTLKAQIKPEGKKSALYYALMEEWDKKTQEERSRIEETVRKVLGEFYDEVASNRN